MLSKIDWVVKTILYYFALLVFGVGTLLYNVVCIILNIFTSKKFAKQFNTTIGVSLLKFYFWSVQKMRLCNIELPEVDAITAITAPIIVANHTGLMDAVIMNTLFPGSSCVFKSALTHNPCFSHILQNGEHLSNDEGIDMIRKGAELTKSGCRVVVFPEGTRNVNTNYFSFKKGFALIAKRANAPIALFSIENPQFAFSKELGLLGRPKLPFQLKFRILDQIDFDKNESIANFVERVETIYNQAFQSNPNEPNSARANVEN